MNKTRNDWRQKVLPNSQRTIIGFDLRRPETVNNIFMTSYDDTVRYEVIEEKLFSHLSGINLFSSDPQEKSFFNVPNNSRVIAFDLPDMFVRHLLSNLISAPNPLPVNIEYIKQSWVFCGFDIVDAITQTSAFHGFDFSDRELNKISKKRGGIYGEWLIDDFCEAIVVAKRLDKLIPEHIPFMPCGIWLKPTKDEGGSGSEYAGETCKE